jgi:hypothetical protein
LNKYEFFPKKLQQDELFKEFLETFDEFTTPIEATFVDVTEKYSGSEDLPEEAINDILKEKGLESLAELLSVSPVIDKHAVLAYSNVIAALKGTDTGYFLVLNLLNFVFECVPWFEQSPKGKFHTIAFDVQLDASIIPEPYRTFQGIKRFTRDYVLPVIDPLGYTYFVKFDGPAITMKGAAHPTYDSYMDDSVNENHIYGNSGWNVADTNGQVWKIKVNENGGLKAFPFSGESVYGALFFKNGLDQTFFVTVTPGGFIIAVPSPASIPPVDFVILSSHNHVDWPVYVDNDGIVTTGIPEESFFLTQENAFMILLEDDFSLLH